MGSGAVEGQGWLGMQVSDTPLVYTSPMAHGPTLDTVYPAKVFLHLSGVDSWINSGSWINFLDLFCR